MSSTASTSIVVRGPTLSWGKIMVRRRDPGEQRSGVEEKSGEGRWRRKEEVEDRRQRARRKAAEKIKESFCASLSCQKRNTRGYLVFGTDEKRVRASPDCIYNVPEGYAWQSFNRD